MKKIIFILIAYFGSLGAFSAQAQCDSTYITQTLQAGQWIGDWAWSFISITPEQEEEVGDQMLEYMSESFKLLPNDSRQKKLEKILSKITANVKRKEIKYDIHLIEDDELINAFAVAGGHLFVTTGIMKWVESDDELAFIIGHEVGHVDLEHCIRNVKRSITIQSWADFFEVGDYAGVIDQGQAILGTPFGQVDEYMSDREGAYLAWKAGYDPSKGKNFFTKLEALEGKSSMPQDFDVLMRTHPYSSQRSICLDHYINNEMKNKK
jgi:predicted Zn-dependent protease